MNNRMLVAVFCAASLSTDLTPACQISLYPIQFGIYSGLAVQARGTVILENCPSTANIRLNAGLYSNGQFAARAMANGTGHRVAYNLYADAGFTHLWGDGTQGTQTVQAGLSEVPIYAYVPPQRMPPEGIYSDSVMVVVEW